MNVVAWQTESQGFEPRATFGEGSPNLGRRVRRGTSTNAPMNAGSPTRLSLLSGRNCATLGLYCTPAAQFNRGAGMK